MSIDFLAQAIAATAPKYLKGAVDQTLRRHFLLSFLIKSGRVMRNASGTTLNWTVTYKQPPVRTSSGQKPTFSNLDNKLSASIGWAQIESTAALDRNTQLINKANDTQIVNLAQSMVDDTTAACVDKMNRLLYVDNSDGSTDFEGLGTIFSGASVGADTDRVAIPGSGATYAGISMELGNYGGNWDANLPTAFNTALSPTSDWPEGDGDTEYDFWSPKALNYDGAWRGSGDEWKTNCEEVMRRAPVIVNALGGEGAAPSLHVLNKGMYSDFQTSVSDKERLHPDDYAAKLGFPSLDMRYAGALLTYDQACPSGVGYAVNPERLSLHTVHEDLFYIDGPSWDMKEQAHLLLIGFLGQLQLDPKYIVQYGSYEAA